LAYFSTHTKDLSVRALQVNCESVPPGPKNPYANAFVAKEQPLLTVKSAQRLANPASARAWKMTNPTVRKDC